MREKRRRAWTSITAAAVLLPAAVSAAGAATGLADGVGPGRGVSPAKAPLPLSDRPVILAAGGEGGEGGEAGGGGEGGEAGIDVSKTATDPVVFLTALDVIRAHYHAGLTAYGAGDNTAGAEMFAHAFSEVYADLGATLKTLGAPEFDKEMQATIDAATAGASAGEVESAAGRVFNALDEAEKHAPPSTKKPLDIEKAALADMLNRAALQYGTALKAKDAEPYLDGFGFYAAARSRAAKIKHALFASSAETSDAVAAAIAALEQAYPGIKRPAAPPIEPGAALAAVSKADLALLND